MVSFLPLMVTMLMLFGGGAGANHDYLDLIPSESYWQVKGITPTVEQLKRDAAPDKAPENVEALIKDLSSDDFKTRNNAKARLEAMGPSVAPQLKPAAESKDPEVAAVAATLLKKFTETGRAHDVQRLMAIRMLGEKQEKSALPMLKELAASKDLFVADYAQQAIARIDGKPLVRDTHQKELLGDLKLLPKDTGIVCEVVGMEGVGISLGAMIDDAIEARGGMGGGDMPGGKAPDKKKLMLKATKSLLQVADRVGNIRVDGIMLGVAKDVGAAGGANGWVIVSLRGKYDAAAVVATMKTLSQDSGPSLKVSREGTVDILELGGKGTVLLPSNEQLIFLGGVRGEAKDAMLKEILAVINGGKGHFEENQELAALIKTVDTSLPAWGAGFLNKDMRKVKSLEAFDTVTLTATQAKGAVTYVFTAKGADEEKVKASADDLTTNLQQGITQAKAMAGQMKQLQGSVEALESIKVTANGKAATMTGELKPAALMSSLGSVGAFWMMQTGPEEMEPAESQPAGTDK